MKEICTVLFVLILCLKTDKVFSQKRFGNEWINIKQSYFRIPVTKTGFYSLTGEELLKGGIPIDSIPANAFQIFRRGTEIAIHVEHVVLEKLTPESTIQFYGERNDGASDSSLYIRPDAMPHPHYSLYSDTASYFLTWRKNGDAGKRIQIEAKPGNSDTISYHLTESLQLYTAFYATGNFYPPGSSFDSGIALSTYDVGEGWTGQELKSSQWGTFPIQTQNPAREQFSLAKIEMTLVGRTAGNHETEIWTGTPERLIRKLTTPTIFDYNTITVDLFLDQKDLDPAGKLVVSAISVKNTGSVSVSAIRWMYPQKTILSATISQREFLFDAPMNGKTWKFKNAEKLHFYDCTYSSEPKELKPERSSIRIDGINKIVAVNEFLRPGILKPVQFKYIDTTQINYLIITHPSLRNVSEDPVEDYANYRASEKGGSYKPFIINSQEIYDRFNYGEPGPLGIRNLIKWLNRYDKLKFVLIIGRSADPQTARKSADPRNVDQIPNAGWPGSDLALATDPGQDAASYIPSVPVGRISAENPEQVRAYLRKVIAMEAEPRSAPWRKNILHLSGGRSVSELSLFRSYVDQFSKKLEKSDLAAFITTISKKTDDPVEQFPLDQNINKGVALMTLFGHSGLNVTDLDIGYASDPARNYKNAPFYPAVIVNGCATGSIFYSSKTISSDWILAPGTGAILFLASTFNGISTALKHYTDSFYEVLADSSFTGEAFGTIQKEAIRRNLLRNSGISDKIACQQMVLQGDPAIRIFPARLPDFTIDSTSLVLSATNGKLLTTRDDTISIRLKIANYGRQKNTPYTLSVSRKTDSGVSQFDYQLSSTDSVRITIPNTSKTSAPELWTFTIDPENKIAEENENNNTCTFVISLPYAGAFPLLPPAGYVSGTRDVELVAQVPEDKKDAEVTFEWSRSEIFSPSTKIATFAEELIARQKISLPDSSKIFWRVYLKEDQAHPSQHRTLQYSNDISGLQLPEVIAYKADVFSSEVPEGAIFKANIRFQSVTDIPFSDSITIQTVYKTEKTQAEEFTKIAPLLPRETRDFQLDIKTYQSPGKHQFSLNFNHSKLPEEIYSNNQVSFTFNVIPDQIPPVLSVSVDNRQLHDLEIVSPQPLIKVQVSDENKYLIRSDTTGIEIWLTGDCLKCLATKLDLRSALVRMKDPNIFEVSVKPPGTLSNGTFLLLVKAKDVSGNMASPDQIRFRVQNIPRIADAGVSPNPAGQWFRFYMDLEGGPVPETWTIQISDAAGRKIKKLKGTLHLGRNELFWHPLDLPAGIYLYDIMLSNPGQISSEETQKGFHGKLIWAP